VDRSLLLDLLERVRRGELPTAEAVEVLRRLPFAVLGATGTVIDHHRALRTGVPEVVYGAGKTAAQIAGALRELAGEGQGALATRVDAAKAAAVLDALADLAVEHHALAQLLVIRPAATAPRPVACGKIAVVCAGTSDLPVAEEAALTAEFLGAEVIRVSDVGVAGLHRLLARLDDLRAAEVVIAVAGMEAALPSVLGGLLEHPMIAVPTSVGYGVATGGLVALGAMLTSCAPGITVVNIDNGFGAAIAAVRIARLARRSA
jgi:hypothetical protein